MNVRDVIAAAERDLPGIPAPDGQTDVRWQAIIRVGEFVQTEPEAVWSFAKKWGSHDDRDLRMAIATCVLEHLLEYHFDLIFPRVEAAAVADAAFADTFECCSKFGQAEMPPRSQRFDSLIRRIRKAHRAGSGRK